MSEAGNDARKATLQLKTAIDNLTQGNVEGWRIDAVMHAIDDLIAVRLAEFAELMAERSESLIGVRL